jgi:hypothetical protein
MRFLKNFLYWSLCAAVIWYAAAVFLPSKGITVPILGIRAYGAGTSEQVPFIPQADATTYGDAIIVKPLAGGEKLPTARPGESFVEEELQRMTNTQISIVFVDNPCHLPVGKNSLVGCVLSNQPTTIFYSKSMKTASGQLVSAMAAHELGHVYQRKLGADFLRNNEAVKAAFPKTDKPQEQLADCMAVYRTGFSTGAYLTFCNSRQLQVAKTVWAGHFPQLPPSTNGNGYR